MYFCRSVNLERQRQRFKRSHLGETRSQNSKRDSTDIRCGQDRSGGLRFGVSRYSNRSDNHNESRWYRQVNQYIVFTGGEIISTRNTQQYNIKSRVFTILGFLLYYQSYYNDPRTVIQRNVVQPGTCWAFQNFPGCLLIRLQRVIYVTGFTLEHVSRLIVPTENISSAPKNFSVWVCGGRFLVSNTAIVQQCSPSILLGVILYEIKQNAWNTFGVLQMKTVFSDTH